MTTHTPPKEGRLALEFRVGEGVAIGPDVHIRYDKPTSKGIKLAIKAPSNILVMRDRIIRPGVLEEQLRLGAIDDLYRAAMDARDVLGIVHQLFEKHGATAGLPPLAQSIHGLDNALRRACP